MSKTFLNHTLRAVFAMAAVAAAAHGAALAITAKTAALFSVVEYRLKRNSADVPHRYADTGKFFTH